MLIQFPLFASSKKTDKIDEDNLVKVTMIPMETSLQARRPTYLAFHFKIKKDWHIYWRNPGDSGIPTSIEIDSGAGFTVGKLIWQIPQVITEDDITNFGYSDECVLRIPIYCSHLLKFGDEIKLKAKAKWLVCKEKCISQSFEDSLILKVENKQPELCSNWKKLVKNEPRNDLTQFFGYWKTEAKYIDNKLEIKINTRNSKVDFSSLRFLPFENGIFCNNCPQSFLKTDSIQKFEITLDKFATEKPTNINGIFIGKRNFFSNEPNAMGFYYDYIISNQKPKLDKK